MRALLLVAALASSARGNECGVDGRTALADWKVLPPPTGKSAPLWRCARDSPCEYRLISDGGAVFAEPDAATIKMPAGAPKAANAFCFDWQMVDGGWLAACDAGLSLFAPDGTRTIVDKSPTTAFVRHDRGLYAVAANGVLRVTVEGGKVAAHRVATLDAKPYVALGQPDRILVATPAGLADVALDGARPARWLKRAPWPGPASRIAVAGDTIYVAMNLAVVRLTKTPAGYLEHWLVPHGCERPAPDRCDCRTPHK